MFDFGKTESAKESSYLKPGVYDVKVTDVTTGKFKDKDTIYLGVKFTTADDVSYEEKFILSEKALPRIQYLHEAWSGKKLGKAFKTPEDVQKYFKDTFVNPKAGTRPLIVGGEVTGDKIYASLPYTGFIGDENTELGEFEEGDDNWKKYVKKSNRTSETAGSKNGILNGGSDDDDDAPTTEAKTTKRGRPAKDKAKEEPKEDAPTDSEDDDLPW